MSQIITLCARCAEILADKYVINEIDEEPARRMCAMCKNSGYFSRYSFQPRQKRRPDGLPKKDTRAGMRK